MNTTQQPPLIQKHKIPVQPSPINNESPITEDSLFDFFGKKSLKLLIAFISGIVGIISNYYAIKYQISQTRIDLLNNGFMSEIYAIGVTLFLDLAIILFHLMRVKGLVWVSSISAIMISLYANMNVIIQNKSLRSLIVTGSLDLAYGGLLLVSLTMAVLPIIILTYMMDLAVKQHEQEKSLNKGK